MANKPKAVKMLAKREGKLTRKAARHRDAPAIRAVGLVAELADQPQLIAVAIATIGAGLIGRRPDLTRGGVRMLAAHLTATAMKSAIKRGVDRSRPNHEMDGNAAVARKGQRNEHALNSFPSGHTAGAVAAARALSRDVEGAAMPAGLAAGAVGLAQPITGSHHLTDVIAGATIGWAAEALVSAVFDRVEPKVERLLAGDGEQEPATVPSDRA